MSNKSIDFPIASFVFMSLFTSIARGQMPVTQPTPRTPIQRNVLAMPSGRPILVSASPISSEPFSASFELQRYLPIPAGSISLVKSEGRLVRDSHGRTFNETVESPKVPDIVRERAHTIIYDPEIGRRVELTPSEHTARRMIVQNKALVDNYPPHAGTFVIETIDGISVQHYSERRTLPVSVAGKDQPIEIVTEYWYSPELKLDLMAKRNDPRTGEDIMRLKNLKRGEPDSSLFEVPPGYTVIDIGSATPHQ